MALGAFDDIQVRFCHRMLCNEDRAAVLIRQNRCLVRTDFFGNIDDLLFVETDQRTEDRHGADFVGNGEGMHRLACHLSDTLSGDQAKAFVLTCKRFCDLHHITAHDDGQLVVRAFFVDCKLDLGEVDHMQTDRAAVACNEFCKIHNLLFGSLAGVRRSVEVNGINLNTAFCDHVSGNRTVDTAGKQQHGLSLCADRHTARACDALAVQINLLTQLDVQIDIRLVNVYFEVRADIEDAAAQLAVDFHCVHRIVFVRTACAYLKGFLLGRVQLFHVGNHCLCQIFKAGVL